MSKAKKVTTVADILSKDDVNFVLDDVVARKDTIKELICIYCCDDDGIFHATSAMPLSRVVYLLEIVKHVLLNDSEKEDGLL